MGRAFPGEQERDKGSVVPPVAAVLKYHQLDGAKQQKHCPTVLETGSPKSVPLG